MTTSFRKNTSSCTGRREEVRAARTGHPRKSCVNILHVGICDDGDKAREADDGAAGAAGGGDIRGVQLAGYCKHTVGVCYDGDKAGEADDGAARAAGGGDVRGVQLAG